MGMFKYVTNRTFTDSSGKDAGMVKVFVKNDSDVLEGKYICPACGNEGVVSQRFEKPLKVKCGKCGHVMNLPKLKGKK